MDADLWDYDVNAQFIRVYLFSTSGVYYDVSVDVTGCPVTASGFTCACDSEHLPGLTGACDTSLCADRVTFCLNGGSCDDYDVTSRCLCPPQYSGANCETSTFSVCFIVKLYTCTCTCSYAIPHTLVINKLPVTLCLEHGAVINPSEDSVKSLK